MLKQSLFYTFLIIFAATALVTLLGITQIRRVDRRYLNVLFTSLLVALAGAVIALYKRTDFFGEEKRTTPSLRDELVGTRWQLKMPNVQWPIVFLRDGKIMVYNTMAPAPEFNSWEVDGSNT